MIPLFGYAFTVLERLSNTWNSFSAGRPTFPSTCLSPDQPGYGQILGGQQGKRRGRRAAVPLPLSATLPPPQPSDFDTSSGDAGQQTRQPGPSSLPPLSAVTPRDRAHHLLSPSQIAGPSGTRQDDYRDDPRYSRNSSRLAGYSYSTAPTQTLSHTVHGYGSTGSVPPVAARTYRHPSSPGSQRPLQSTGPIRDFAPFHAIQGIRNRDRFSPYENAAHLRQPSGDTQSPHFSRPSPVDLPPLNIPSSQPSTGSGARSADITLGRAVTRFGSSIRDDNSSSVMPSVSEEVINLPPIRPHSSVTIVSDDPRYRPESYYPSGGRSGFSLHPISVLSSLPPPPASGSTSSQLDSAAVLKRLALDDEAVGASRRTSFVATSNGYGSHRDDEDDDVGHSIDPPTREQLSRRRRSLSEPLLQL